MIFKTELKDVWKKELEYLSDIDPVKDKELYRTQMNRLTDIEKQLTELERIELQIENDAANHDMDEQIKRDQMELDRKDRNTKNFIEFGKFVLPVVAAVGMGLFSMKWEKVDVLTSTAGKASLRDALKMKL